MRTLVQRDDARIQSLAEDDNPAGRLRDERSTVVTLRTVRRVLRDATRHRWEVFPRVISLAVKRTDCLLNLRLSLLRLRRHRRKSPIGRIHDERGAIVSKEVPIVPEFVVRTDVSQLLRRALYILTRADSAGILIRRVLCQCSQFRFG